MRIFGDMETVDEQYHQHDLVLLMHCWRDSSLLILDEIDNTLTGYSS